MAVRHAIRYVRSSVERDVRANLDRLDWFGPTVPFSAKPVEVLSQAIKESDLVPVTSNSVFVSFGMQSEQLEVELGNGVVRHELTVFIDVLGENESVALAIATDLSDCMHGRLGGNAYLLPTNPATGAHLPGYSGEFRRVVIESPNESVAHWQSVKAVLVLDFPGDG